MINLEEIGGDKEVQHRKLPPLPANEEEAQRSFEDQISTKEAKQLSSGLSANEIEKRERENEAGRAEKFRDHFEGIAIVTLYIVWSVLVIVGLLWVYHIAAPPDWWHLPDQQVRQLHGIVTGGVLAGFASGHVKKRLGT